MRGESDLDTDALENEFQNIDPKVLQIQQLQELMAIRQQLQLLNQSLTDHSESETKTYTCQACMETVPSDERISHATQDHNAPPVDDPEELGLYE